MTRKKRFLERCACFKFINLGLALGMTLKFYAGVARELKLTVRTFWGLIHRFVQDTGEKTGRRAFLIPPLILNRVNTKTAIELFYKKTELEKFTIFTGLESSKACNFIKKRLQYIMELWYELLELPYELYNSYYSSMKTSTSPPEQFFKI